MLSRVADSIYWLSRYVERAENIARFVDVNLNLSLDLPGGVGEQWEPLIEVTGDREIFRSRYAGATRENVVRFLAFDSEYPNSILSCVRSARENARAVRDAISLEMWEAINRFYLMMTESNPEETLERAPDEFFGEVRRASHLFVGISTTTMSHSEGWHFARLGRLIERADKTSRLVDVKYYYLLPDVSDVGTPLDDVQWSALLRSVSALEAYRRRYQRISPRDVVEFLVLDRFFPRSIHHCLDQAAGSLRNITGSSPGSYANPAEQLANRLYSELAFARVEDVVARGLHEFIDDFQLKLNAIDDAVFATYFAMKPLSVAAGRAGGE